MTLAASLALFEVPTTIIGDSVDESDRYGDLDSETGADLLDDGEEAGPFDEFDEEGAK
jgi:hypothetical protein